MGNLKRFLAMTLTMLMVVGCFVMTGSVAAFDDVVDYQQQINLMSVLKIIEGYAEDEFGPDNDVERWHMALWIAKIMTGKVDDAYVNWYSTSNNTAFADLAVDNFYGSISYCNENGVVIGTSATTFEPTRGIMIQDVFTMVVRMLGYGSRTMDDNYPWSYVDKAIQLGLDNGLADDYNNEDVATREQAAVILYNALFARKSDGTSYAQAKFNLTMSTVVLTGTSKANMFAAGDVQGKKLAGENYVAFNELNDNGTLGSETFYLLKSWFGFDDETDENLYFGQSYNLITKDNYTSLIYCEAVEGVWVDQTEFDGTKDSNDVMKVEGKSYKAVKEFTYLNFAQGSKNTDELEVIVYDTNNRTTVNDATSYAMDGNRNIVGSDGKTIVFHYMPAGTTANTTHVSSESAWKDAYKKEVTISGNKVFVTPSQADWDNVYKYATKTSTGAMRMVGSNTGFRSHDLMNRNAYSDTVLYDDDADGDYDRAMYTYYKFGFISYNDDKYVTIDGKRVDAFGDTKYDNAAFTYVTADGEKLTADDVMKSLDSSLAKGNYVLYTYNVSNKYITIKEFFTPNSGLVTSIDKPNSTITFDQVYYNVSAGNVTGTKFTIGNAKLPGATKDEAIAKIPNGDLDQLQGRNVHYVEKDGCVLAIYEAYNNAGKYFVFDSVVGINSTGYVNALVYNNSNTRSVVTIASVQGDWYGYSNYNYTSNADWLNNFGYGELFSYTTDALGNYHVTWLDSDNWVYNDKGDTREYGYYYNRYTGFDNVWLQFKNGIAFPVFDFLPANGIAEFKFFDNNDGIATPFAQFATNNDTVIVVLNRDKVLNAFKGVPVDGAKLNLYRETDDDGTLVEWFASYFSQTDPVKVFVAQTDNDKPTVAKFIYVMGGTFSSFTTRSAWNYQTNDTIIFVDDDTAATEVFTNQTSTGYGVTLGAVYSYNKAIDFVNGGLKDGILTYNIRLTKGNFYGMKDNYVEEFIPLSDPRIGNGQLVYIDTYEAVVQAPVNGIYTKVIDTNYKASYLYKLSGTEIEDTKANNEDVTPKNKIADEKAKINTDGAFAPVYFYDGNLDSSANVFIYESITAGAKADETLYIRNDWVAENVEILGWDTIDAGAYIGSIDILDITIPYFTPELTNYQFSGTHANYGAFNWYEITSDVYYQLSSQSILANDGRNYVIKDLGTNMKLYDKDGKLVPGFTNANVTAFTQLMYTNAGGYKYFLVFTSTPSGTAERVGGTPGNYTLRWTETNSITERKIELKSSKPDSIAGFGLDPFRFVIGNHNMYNVPVYAPGDAFNTDTFDLTNFSDNLLTYLLREYVGIDIIDATPRLFGNYSTQITGKDVQKTNLLNGDDWKTSFAQYIGLPIDNIGSVIDSIIGDGSNVAGTLAEYASQVTYRWVPQTGSYDMYLRVPTVLGYEYTIDGYYLNTRNDGTGYILNWELVVADDAFTATKIDTVWYQEMFHDVYRISFKSGLERNVLYSVNYFPGAALNNVTPATISGISDNTLYMVDSVADIALTDVAGDELATWKVNPIFVRGDYRLYYQVDTANDLKGKTVTLTISYITEAGATKVSQAITGYLRYDNVLGDILTFDFSLPTIYPESIVDIVIAVA